jgi:hypothetical protein
MSEEKQEKPKQEGKGYWVENPPSGKKLFCYKARHNGKKKAIKLTLAQIREAIR